MQHNFVLIKQSFLQGAANRYRYHPLQAWSIRAGLWSIIPWVWFHCIFFLKITWVLNFKVRVCIWAHMWADACYIYPRHTCLYLQLTMWGRWSRENPEG